MKKISTRNLIAGAILLTGLTTGCSSTSVLIAPKPPANAKPLGRVEGSAAGSVFLAFFPIGENTRTKRAYKMALAKAPGATALTDVTLQENWYWYGLGTVRITTINGEAVK